VNSGRISGTSSNPRSLAPVVVALALTGVFCSGMAISQVVDLPSLVPGGRSGGPALEHSVPTRIAIPSLGVRAGVVEVGLAADGSIDAPTEDPAESAGWYSLGPTPGEAGTSVIVGHVDTDSRPALFHRLHTLRRGQTIEVSRRDNRVATFTVELVRAYPKTAFPVDQVFVRSDRPRLVLVTCGGDWVGGDVGYAENVIVFATLA
jgi:hypothetical protein